MRCALHGFEQIGRMSELNKDQRSCFVVEKSYVFMYLNFLRFDHCERPIHPQILVDQVSLLSVTILPIFGSLDYARDIGIAH